MVSISDTYSYLSESTFPDIVDDMDRMSDLEASDMILVNEYYRLYNSGNINAAKELLISNPQLNTKIFNALKFNKLSDGIVATQQFFRDNVKSYIDNTKTMLEEYVNEFSYKGEYSSTTQYYKKNIVSYLGCAYICNQDSMGQAPIYNQSSIYWILIARGIQGESGLGLTPRGSWETSVLYYIQDWVYHSNCIWECKVENINSEPSLTNANWSLVMNFLPLTGVRWGDLVGLNNV